MASDKPTDTTPDCGPLVLRAVTNAAARASGWDRDAARIMLDTVTTRVSASPMSPLQAVLTTTLMPSCFQTAFPPLAESTTPSSGPPASLLAPQPEQGITSWYWILLQGDDWIPIQSDAAPSLSTQTTKAGTSAAATGVSILIVFKQTSFTPVGSVWSLDMGIAHAGTWSSPNTVYMAPSEVNLLPDGVQFASSTAFGNIRITPTAFEVSITMNTGLAVTASATSQRGPTYEQAGGNIKQLGNVQNGYWSIVDGMLSTLAYRPAGSSTTMQFTAGVAWLDYQQIGLTPLSGFDQFMMAAMGGVHNVYTPTGPAWLFVVVQTPTLQLSAYILSGSALTTFKSNKITPVLHVANVWQTGQPAQYNVPIQFRQLGTYAGTDVPAFVQLTLPTLGMTFVLQSVLYLFNPAPAPPLLSSAAGSGYESPAQIIQNGTLLVQGARGVIEWVTPGLYPTTLDALSGSGLPASILDARKPSASAVATLVTVLVLIVAAFLALVVGLPLALQKRRDTRRRR